MRSWSAGRWWPPVVTVLALVASAGCGSESDRSDGASGALSSLGGTTVDPSTEDAPGASLVATDLAPSQLVGSTVPAPERPVLCEFGDLEFWTAQLVPGVSTVDAVIRVRNAGDVRCDADIARSPHLDPAIEVDVWLDRGQTADLIVGQMTSECPDPSVVSSIDVAIGEMAAEVPTMVVSCAWWMNAFYPNAPVGDACERDALDLAVTPDVLLVRNRSALPCRLGGTVAVEGAPFAGERASGPSIHELMAGDVVAFGRRSEADCDGPVPQVVLVDEGVGELVFDGVPCEFVFEPGGGRPRFAGPADALDTPMSVSDVAAALNVFDDDT